MRAKHERVIRAIFSNPVRSNIVWAEVESMLQYLGSTVCIELNGRIAVFYRPHPRKETDKGAVKSLRKFLIEAGVDYAGI